MSGSSSMTVLLAPSSSTSGLNAAVTTARLAATPSLSSLPFFFNDTATTEIYTLSLHDALPISDRKHLHHRLLDMGHRHLHAVDRKSTRLNSSHTVISYAVFCLKKKKSIEAHRRTCDSAKKNKDTCTS